MARKSRNPAKVLVVLALLAMALGVGLLGFRTGRFDFVMRANASLGASELLDRVSIRGMISAEDLHLSTREVRAINRTMLRHGKIFSKFDVQLDTPDQQRVRSVEKDTPLVMVMAATDDEGRLFLSWNQTLRRKKLVRSMVRFMDRAADEYKRFEAEKRTRTPFRKFYM